MRSQPRGNFGQWCSGKFGTGGTLFPLIPIIPFHHPVSPWPFRLLPLPPLRSRPLGLHKSSYGVRGALQAPPAGSNLVHFFKVWHLVATMSMILVTLHFLCKPIWGNVTVSQNRPPCTDIVAELPSERECDRTWLLLFEHNSRFSTRKFVLLYTF